MVGIAMSTAGTAQAQASPQKAAQSQSRLATGPTSIEFPHVCGVQTGAGSRHARRCGRPHRGGNGGDGTAMYDVRQNRA
jgi:hypothetical protein